MIDKICKHCGISFSIRENKKALTRQFCGAICSRRWMANNRSASWRKKASNAKQGEHNPMFGMTQVNTNSISNLVRDYWKGKKHSPTSNEKRSRALTGKIVKPESTAKAIQTKIDRGISWKPDDPEYIEFKKYRRKVYYWTNKNNLTSLPNNDKRSKNGFHLDHKYSITEGFNQKVPPEVIGSIHNLEFIPAISNVKKGIKCSITLEVLYELFSPRH